MQEQAAALWKTFAARSPTEKSTRKDTPILAERPNGPDYPFMAPVHRFYEAHK